jgi:pimeloyl-ACP methyl ester carboxylesterase
MARPRMRKLALRDVMTRGHLVPAEEAARLVRSSVRCTVVEDVFATIRDGSARVVGLDRIDVPVLVTWGEQDRILPLDRHADRFRAEIPNVEFRLMPGLGHTPMWDDANLIAATIGDFAGAAAARGNGQAAGISTPAAAG